MKTLIKGLVVCVLSTLLFSVTVDSVYEAKTLNDLYKKRDELQAEANQTQAQLNEKKQAVSNNQAAINQASQDVIAKTKEIDTSNEEISKLEVEKAKKNEEIKELLQYYQLEDTEVNAIEYILNSDSMTESIHKQDVVEQLTKKSDDKITEFIKIQDDLKVKIEKLNKDITALEQLQKDLEVKISSLNVDISDLTGLKVDAKDQINEINAQIRVYEGLGCGPSEDLIACETRNNVVTPNATGFASPLKAGYITAELGWYNPFGRPSYHTGIDMAAVGEKTIYAAATGTVISTGYDGVRGNHVYIKHSINGSRYTTYYGHMSGRPLVRKGQVVTNMTKLGYQGMTGSATGPHLHFEINRGWYLSDFYAHGPNALNPRKFLSYPGIGVYWSGRNR